MPIEEPAADGPVADQLRRMRESVQDLSARIARLATNLGVDLENEAELSQVLHLDAGRAPVLDRRVNSDRRTATRTEISPDRRKSHLREELRGLLVLRYGVASSYVERVGVDATRSILVSAQEQLVREGFKPGADGANLRKLLKKS